MSTTLELVASDRIFEKDFVEWVRARLTRTPPEDVAETELPLPPVQGTEEEGAPNKE